jgi:WD40 repeat protein
MKMKVAEPRQRALCLAISPDGHMLAAGCTDRSIYLLGPLSGEKRITLAGVQRGYVRGVAFIPGTKTIVSIGDDDELRFWDATSGKLLKGITALGDLRHAGLPPLLATSLAVSPDGSLIAMGGSGTADRSGEVRMDENSFFEIRVLDTKSGESAWSKAVRRGFMHQLAFSPDGKTLASDTLDGVTLWDARSGELKQSVKPRSGTVWAVAFSSNNLLLAGCGMSTAEGRRATWLTLWDLNSGAIVRSIEAGEAGAVSAPGTLAFSPDSKSLASAGTRVATGLISIGGGNRFRGSKVVNYVKLWDVTTGALHWKSSEGDIGNITSLLFSPDGLSLYCCDESATSRIDARTGQTRRDLMRAGGGDR